MLITLARLLHFRFLSSNVCVIRTEVREPLEELSASAIRLLDELGPDFDPEVLVNLEIMSHECNRMRSRLGDIRDMVRHRAAMIMRTGALVVCVQIRLL